MSTTEEGQVGGAEGLNELLNTAEISENAPGVMEMAVLKDPAPPPATAEQAIMPEVVDTSKLPAEFLELAHIAELEERQVALAAQISRCQRLSADQMTAAASEITGAYALVQQINLATQKRTAALYYYAGVFINALDREFGDDDLMEAWLDKNVYRKPSDKEVVRQMRQLANTGPEILKYCRLGKNRALEVVYLVKEMIDKQCPEERLTVRNQLLELERQFPPPSTPDLEKDDLKEFRVYVDAIATKYWFDRALRDKSICSYEDAESYADKVGDALEMDQAKAAAEVISGAPDKCKALKEWIAKANKRKRGPQRSEPDAKEVSEYLAQMPKKWCDDNGNLRPEIVATVIEDDTAKQALGSAYPVLQALYERVFPTAEKYDLGI